MKPDVWLRSDYQHNIALGEVHLVRACKEQHDVDFVPLYDSETVEGLVAERDALQTRLVTLQRILSGVTEQRDALRAFAQDVMGTANLMERHLAVKHRLLMDVETPQGWQYQPAPLLTGEQQT